MKNFKILGLVLISLFLFSCESDDDATTNPDANELNNTNFVGTYNVTALSASGTEISTFNGTTETETFTLVGSAFNNTTFTFAENGTVTTAGTFTTTAVYTINGVDDTEVDVSDIDLSGTYQLSGNSLVFSNGDGETVTVRNFSSNGMELFFEINEVDADGSYVAEGTYTLVRQ